MGIHRSALKRERQINARRERNRSVHSTLKTLIKKTQSAIEGNKLDVAQKNLGEVTSALDKAVTKGYIHRNTASRKVSRLTLKVNLMSPGGKEAKPNSKPSSRKKKEE